jgi:hypothetical protein
VAAHAALYRSRALDGLPLASLRSTP